MSNQLYLTPIGNQKSHTAIDIMSRRPHARNCNQIGWHLLPLIAVLRVFGPYPIILHSSQHYSWWRCRRIRPDDSGAGGCGALFETGTRKWRCPIIMYSYCLTIFNVFCWIVFIMNKGIGVPYPLDVIQAPELYKNVHDVGINSIAYRISMVAEGVIKLFEMVIIFYNTEFMVDWLNNWNLFERDFGLYFSPKNIWFEFRIKSFQTRVLVFYFLIPAFFWVGLDTYVMLPRFERTAKYFWSFIFLLWINILLMGHTLLEDSKTLLMMKTTQIAFSQMRHALDQEIQSNLIIASDVGCWRKLIQNVRAQVHLCGEAIKCRQLILLLETVIIFSIAILMAQDIIFEVENLGMQTCFLVCTISYCIICCLRLYFMTLLSEKIYNEERLLALDILSMQNDHLCMSTNNELKFLYMMLTQSPSMITLGNYVKVNKKMLLRVGIQVLTFVIALMQFNSTIKEP